MPENTQEDQFMQRALALAEETVALASPNPRVGCVLVKNGAIIGEGAHIYDSFDHAEIVALRHAGKAALGATAYVTLEPCSHHGRTGPCADALIAAGVTRVIAATKDPNPQVAGRGVEKLRAAGVQVEVGTCSQQARALNDGFAWFIGRKRPFVTLKTAVSSDGKIAPAQQKPGAPALITGLASRQQVQRMRHASDAILTGIGTVLADDPALTDHTELPRRRRLLRVVLDAALRTPLTSQLVSSAASDLLIFCTESTDPEIAARQKALEAAGAQVLRIPSSPGGLDLHAVLAELSRRELLSVLIEAGSRVNGAFLREDLVDKVVIFRAPKPLGEDAIPFAEGFSVAQVEAKLQNVTQEKFNGDECISGYLHDAWRIS